MSGLILLTHCDHADPSVPWREDHLQAAIVQWLRRNDVEFHADMGGMATRRSTAAKAKQLGLEAGVPDLHVYLPGRYIQIELKCGARVSKDQADRIARRRALGCEVHVVRERTPAAAVDAVRAILKTPAPRGEGSKPRDD